MADIITIITGLVSTYLPSTKIYYSSFGVVNLLEFTTSYIKKALTAEPLCYGVIVTLRHLAE